MLTYIKCHECMKNAPYRFCCKEECGKREECKECSLEIRGDKCPNNERYIPEETK